MKLSTSRDFRINAATLDAALQEQDDSQVVSASSAPQELQYCSTYTTASSLHFYFIIWVHKTDSISTLFPRLKCACSLMLWMLWAKSRSFFPSTRSLCLFVFVLPLLSDHRVTGHHRDTRTQTEEEETVRSYWAPLLHTRTHVQTAAAGEWSPGSCMFGIKAVWSTKSYLPLFREPLVMSMIW